MGKYLIGGAVVLAAFSVTFATLAYSAQSPVKQVRQSITKSAATILFTGDVMLDRTIRTALDQRGPDAIFGQVAPLLRSADFVAGNLEGPITENASQSVGTNAGDEGNTKFTFEPRVAAILASYGFKLVSIGNNHITDFGRTGVTSTQIYLTDTHVAYVGDPFSTSTEPMIEDIQGIKVAFAAYDQFINPNAEQTRSQISRARGAGADFTVVIAHWGVEYQTTPPSYVRALAATFAAAGADLIIGTHPHVIGDTEDIGSTRVYYSLGNFIFDQYWDESVRCGLTVSVTLTKVGTTTTASYSTQNVHLDHSRATTLECPASQNQDTPS